MKKSVLVSIFVGGTIILSVWGWRARSSFERRLPEPKWTAAIAEVRRDIGQGIAREIQLRDDLTPLAGLESPVKNYEQQIQGYLGRGGIPKESSAELAQEFIEPLLADLKGRGVSTPDRIRAVNRLGKLLYQQAMIWTAKGTDADLLRARLFKLSIAHFDASKKI